MIISMYKIKNSDCFFEVILVIKKSWNLIGQEATGHTPTKSFRCYLPLLTNSIQKAKISIDPFKRNWRSKNTGIQFNKRLKKPHLTMSGSPRCYFPLMTNLMHKKLWDMNWFSLTDQRILQSDWMRSTPGHSQP